MRLFVFLMILLVPPLLWAGPAELQAGYAAQVRSGGGAGTFDAARGQQFFNSTHGGEWSCSSCHTKDPRQSGRHAVTGKTIAPMAPAVNPERFARGDKVEKWFRRNCRDVVSRECTAQEKGDVMAYLMSLK